MVGAIAAGPGVYVGSLDLAARIGPRNGDVVRRPRRNRNTLDAGRLLVRVREYSDLSIHSNPMVSAAWNLVPVFVARVTVEIALGAHASRPCRRNRVSGRSSYAFGPLLFAQGTLVAGLIASRILYHAESLNDFKTTIGVFVALFVPVILGPLTMFTGQLSRAKRRGLGDYGTLATGYVTDFDEKWVRGGAKGDEILGTPDLQSLADLGTSYAVVKEMRLVPFGLSDVARLAAATALPVVPLFLTIMPLEELVTQLLKIFF